MRVDIMTDIETLGTNTDSTIIQISAVAFDITTGEIHRAFNRIADIEKNDNEIKVTAGTLKWWQKINPELFSDLLNGGTDSSEGILSDFYEWLSNFEVKNTYLWGNGILFDNKMIQAQMENIGLNYPIHYKNDRDVRTILELTAMKKGLSEKDIKEVINRKMKDKNLTHHNALDDCYWQVELVHNCYVELMEGY